MSQALDQLMKALSRLPGIGRRSAQRIAFALVRRPERLGALVETLTRVGESVRLCSKCGSVTTVDADPCRLCLDASRVADVLCVVEEPTDIVAIEQSGGFHGRYHALLGRISPMSGTGPDDVRLERLMTRVREEQIAEVILALGTDVEGDATASYVADALHALGVKVTRLALGLPADSGVGYSDPVTLGRALRGRIDA